MFRDKPTRNGGPGFFITTPRRPRELRFLLTTGLFVGGFFARNTKHYIEREMYNINQRQSDSARQKKRLVIGYTN